MNIKHALLSILFLPGLVVGQELAIIEYDDLIHPELGDSGMVASQSRYASEVGAAVLADGGNAVDAAIATGLALAVTLPRAGNIGGGGFMMIHDDASDEQYALDYREMAPPKASRDMYLDEEGNVDNGLARYSHQSAGIPGTVAGFWKAHQRFGSLPWKRLVEPAIRLAEDGFAITYDQVALLSYRRERFCQFEAACRYFFKEDGSSYRPNEVFRQPDLADTLRRIAKDGPDGFYRGRTAKLIADEMRRYGGLIDEAALATYEAVWREPIRGTYRGYDIVTMPPPSSGGIHLVQMLNMLEEFDVAAMGAGSADAIHLMAEVARYAYADRSKYLGDPDFVEVPLDALGDKDYARSLASLIDLKAATNSDDVAAGNLPGYESPDTTHYSVIDKDGNMVSNTYTLNFSFGSGIAVEGAGFLLNNEMDDFSAKEGVANAYGLLGGDANAIEPAKRPLSSMTPTLVFSGGEPWFATGSPGGSRIITTVLQAVVNSIDHDMNLAEAAAFPRMHHQWKPDKLRLDPGFSPDTIRELQRRGHEVSTSRYAMGSVQSVGLKDGVFRGASDPRRPNAASVPP